MHSIDNIFILTVMAVFILTAAAIPFSSRYGRSWRRWLATVAGFLLALGAIAFLGNALSANGGLNWLPKSFEWPVGYATGVVSTNDGLHVVPLEPSGRIQVYNPDWSFRTGWHVDAGGGTFKLQNPKDDHLEVITARGNHFYVFDLNGNLLSQKVYGPESYNGYPNMGNSLVVPTAPWMWPFTSPFIAWFTAALGGIILVLLERLSKLKAK